MNLGKTFWERVHSSDFSFPRSLVCWLFYVLCLHTTPSALFWEADLYGLHHPDYLASGLLFEFCQWKVLAGDLRAGRESKVRAFISLLPFCLLQLLSPYGHSSYQAVPLPSCSCRWTLVTILPPFSFQA